MMSAWTRTWTWTWTWLWFARNLDDNFDNSNRSTNTKRRMPTLRPDERRTIERSAGPSDVLASTVARLYEAKASPHEYSFSGLVGAVALVRSPAGAFAFKLISLNGGQILWEQDVSRDVKYVQDRPFFHSFLGQSCMIGFSFADEDEAASFHDTFARKESLAPTPAPAPMPAPTPAPIPVAAPAPSPVPAQIQQQGMTRSTSSDSVGSKQSKKESGGGGFFGRNRSKTTGKKGKIDKSMISAPSNFEHVSHVGYDPKTGFSAQNIPMEWKIIFQKAGITEEQLQDKKTAKKVAKFMKEHADQLGRPNAAISASAGAAAPASSSAAQASAPARRVPPPPPPSRGTAAELRRRRLLLAALLRSSQLASAASSGCSLPAAASPSTRGSSSATCNPIACPTVAALAWPASASWPSASPTSPASRRRASLWRRWRSSSPASASWPFLGGPPPPPAPAPRAPSPTRAPAPAASDGRSDFLNSIRQGVQLKQASHEPPPAPAAEASADTSDDLADALRNALKKRINAVGGSDSDDDDEDGDDEEW
ncbi:hypothetical protein BC831DRAFT_475328 [Entophlyctis helioformis]|nr:hypothetical protein BC831DRAFT_475328 [Entophlyctis helioformis]